jgi:transposase-like protein
MKAHQYSEDFKQTAVKKFISRGSRSALSISEELGLGHSTLYNWAGDYVKATGMKNPSRTQDRSSIAKVELVIQPNRLEANEQTSSADIKRRHQAQTQLLE